MTTTTAPQHLGRFTIEGYYGTYEVPIVRADHGIYPLTPCCEATGKGMDTETGVGCRACYEEIDPIFGACWTPDEFTAEQVRGAITPIH